jgi:hypothetical protein
MGTSMKKPEVKVSLSATASRPKPNHNLASCIKFVLKGSVSRDFSGPFLACMDRSTTGAVSIATISEKRPGLKFNVFSQKHDRYLCFFSLYTHLQQQYQ